MRIVDDQLLTDHAPYAQKKYAGCTGKIPQIVASTAHETLEKQKTV